MPEDVPWLRLICISLVLDIQKLGQNQLVAYFTLIRGGFRGGSPSVTRAPLLFERLSRACKSSMEYLLTVDVLLK